MPGSCAPAPRAARRRGSSRSPCSGTGCRPAPRGSRRRSAPALRASRSWLGDDQARRAESALHRAGLDERLLHRVQLAAGRQALDGDDLAALGLPGEHQAGADELAVEVDRARAALALLAGVLGARQAEPLAQHVEQALALPDAVGLACLAVDACKRHAHRCCLPAQRQRAPGQHGERVAAVGRAAADVVDRRRRRRDELAEARDGGVGQRPPPSPQAPPRRARREERSASGARSGVGPAEPMPVPTRRGAGSSASANEQTAITIALRVPTLANCCGPGAGPHVDRGDQLVGLRARCAWGRGRSPTPACGACPRRRTRSSTSASAASSGGMRVAGRRGGAEVAADRAAVADLRRAHGARGDGQPRQAPPSSSMSCGR